MAALIGALLEAFVALIAAALGSLPIIIEFIALAAIAIFTVLRLVLSPEYRNKTRRLWAEDSRKKRLELGAIAACFIAIAGLVIGFAILPPNTGTKRLAQPPQGEDLRVRIDTARKSEPPSEVAVVVKKDGVKKIFETKSMSELREAIIENVEVVPEGKSHALKKPNPTQPPP